MPDTDNRAVATVTGFAQVITPGAADVVMSDDFSGTSLDTQKWTFTDKSLGFLSVNESDGQLQASVNITSSGGLWVVAQTAGSYNLAGGYVQARLAALSAVSGSLNVDVYLDSYINGTFGPQGSGPYIGLKGTDGGTVVLVSSLGSVPWSAESMGWVRLRTWQGQVYYEVSPDGSSWTTLWTDAEAAGVVTPALIFSAGPTYYPPGNLNGTAGVADFEVAQMPPNPPTPVVTARAAVVASDGHVVSLPGVTAPFTYGDHIGNIVIDAVRAAAGDPQLDVTIF
jgi:hypothetical protein